MFGLIRKADINELYRHVDKVIARTNIIDLENKAATASLAKMFRVERYFDVTTIRDVSEMCQVIIPRRHMDIYKSMHCISWGDMDEQTREELIALVLKDFEPILRPEQKQEIQEIKDL